MDKALVLAHIVEGVRNHGPCAVAAEIMVVRLSGFLRLDHAFSIRGYEYVRSDYQGGEVAFTIRQERKTFRCKACGSHDVQPRGQAERRFRSLPMVAMPRSEGLLKLFIARAHLVELALSPPGNSACGAAPWPDRCR